MKISPICQPLERPSLEEIKESIVPDKSPIRVVGWLVEVGEVHDWWGKANTLNGVKAKNRYPKWGKP